MPRDDIRDGIFKRAKTKACAWPPKPVVEEVEGEVIVVVVVATCPLHGNG
jgi:hypothetical protein